METLCKILEEVIADERKGIEEYDRLIGEAKKLEPSATPMRGNVFLFALFEAIKADEEKHGITLERVKSIMCK